MSIFVVLHNRDMKNLGSKIIELRKSGKKYDEICYELSCSKASVAYHCKKNHLGGREKFSIPSQKEVDDMQKFYDECQSSIQTAIQFRRSKSTVLKYVTVNQSIPLTVSEKRKRATKAVTRFKTRLKQKAVDYKGGKCEFCGYSKCIQALEFHHKNANQKDFSISQKIFSWEKVKSEIDKCYLVCANCHREIHYGVLKVA